MLKLFGKDWKNLKGTRDSAIRIFKYDLKVGAIFKLFCSICGILILSFLPSIDAEP
jgi:hypothetical protein